MYKDDFILRHIRLFIQSIARIIGLIKEGDLGFAMETIRAAFADLLGMSLDDFLAYPEERLKDFLYFGELRVMGLNRTALAASLLVQAGRVFSIQGKTGESLVCYEKSLILLLESMLTDEAEEEIEMPDFAPPIEEILDEIALNDLNDTSLTQLAFYFDRIRDFRRVDESLQLLLTRHPDDLDMRDLARSFYVNLLDENETALEEGGLPIKAVQDAMGRL